MERTVDPLILNKKDKHRLELLVEEEKIRCMGCGAKASNKVVSYSVKHGTIDNYQRSDIKIGLVDSDDAAVLTIPANTNLVQTVDYLPAVSNFDPYLFGQIAVNHCFSDIFAMGASAHSLLATIVIPKARENIMSENAYQLLKGIVDSAKKLKASLIGGHTAEGQEIALNLTCNGICGEKILSQGGAKVGDSIVLTKSLGVGVIYAAQMRAVAKGIHIDEALDSMLISNMQAAEIISQFNASSCTDVTGFGFVGHLVEILNSSKVSADIELGSIPLLKGAVELNQANVHSSLYSKNLAYSKYITNFLKSMKYINLRLLFDPQTSGGLLFTLDSNNLDFCLRKLKDAGYGDTTVIGRITESKISHRMTIV